MNRGAWELWRVLPRVFPYMRPYRKLTAASYGLTFGAVVIALAEPGPLAIIVDNVLGDRRTAGLLASIFGTHPGRYTLLVFAVLAGFVLTFLSHAITVVNDWTNAKLEQRMVLDLRSDMFAHAQGLSLTFHDGRLTGRLMNQINNHSAAMGGIVVSFPPIVQGALTLIGMFVVACLISWPVAVVSLVAVPFIWYSLGLYGTRIVPRLRRVQELEGESLSIVHEAMSMLRVIVSFGRERHEYARFREQGETAVDERVKLTVRQTLFSLGVTSATAIGTGLVLGVGAWQVIEGAITTGELLVLIAYIAAVYQPLEQISNTIGGLNQQLVALDAAMGLLDTEKEVEEADDAIDIGRAAGAVAFEGVSFAYKGRRDTLKDIDFSVQPGQRVAIVGPTGAGKTTLISLLIRFYDPSRGRISIDGHDVRRLTLESLRNQISVVLQEPLLFSGSIAENIRYGRLGATDEEIVAAARAANAHDFVSRLPKGYDTILGERGAQLSGGERQRICVARAFIKDAPILILDEPTSSIDSKTEGVILDALEDLMDGRTSFMIAHRLSTVRDADLILVMRDGELVEQGTHDELVELEGVYYGLYDAQNRPRVRRSRGRELAFDVAPRA
jgi:ABC-type multidrug transport system fused ATPase/permease subunit